MKKNVVILTVFLALAVSTFLPAGEKRTPQLLMARQSPGTAIDWQWRLGSNLQLFPFMKIETESLRFLDENGRERNDVPYLPHSVVSIAPNRSCIGSAELIGENTLAPEDKIFRYRMHSGDGRLLYSFEKKKPYDEPLWSMYTFSTGRALLTDGARGSAELYDEAGQLAAHIELFDEEIFDYEKPIDCALAEDRGRFYIAAQKRPMTREPGTLRLISGEPWLFCFNLDGEELWRKAVDCPTFTRFTVSPGGQYLLLAHHSLTEQDVLIAATTVYDSDGNSVMEIPGNYRTSAFSMDETTLFLADKKSLYSVDVPKGMVQKMYTLPQSESGIFARLTTGHSDGGVIGLVATSVFQNNRFEFGQIRVQKFTATGASDWMIDLGSDILLTPTVHVEQSQLAVGFVSNYKIFRENRD
ncbi:MAG: hypothetical protein ACOY90_05270 [Candidatus Zhuqueibacterota bacterium]